MQTREMNFSNFDQRLNKSMPHNNNTGEIKPF